MKPKYDFRVYFAFKNHILNGNINFCKSWEILRVEVGIIEINKENIL